MAPVAVQARSSAADETTCKRFSPGAFSTQWTSNVRSVPGGRLPTVQVTLLWSASAWPPPELEMYFALAGSVAVSCTVSAAALPLFTRWMR